MKHMNIVFTGMASLISLSVLVSCSDRMGGMKSAKEIRHVNCEKYNAWARKNGKAEICKGTPSGGGVKKPTGPVQPPRVDDGPAKGPDSVSGNGNGTGTPVTGTTPQQPGKKPDELPVTINDGPRPGQQQGPQPGSGDNDTPATPGQPQVPSIQRAEFNKDLTESLTGESAKHMGSSVKGITINLGRSQTKVAAEVLAVVLVETDNGKEYRKLVAKAEQVNLASDAEVTRISPELSAKMDAQVEPLNDRAYVYASCLDDKCEKVGVIFDLNHKDGRRVAGCEIEVASGKKKCGSDVPEFADVVGELDKPALPIQQGDISGSQTGDISGGQQGDISGSTPAQPPMKSDTNAKFIESAGEALKTVIQQHAQVMAAAKAVEEAKKAQDENRAGDALDRAELANNGLKEAQAVIASIVDDISQREDATQEELEKISQIGKEAYDKAQAAEAELERVRSMGMTPGTVYGSADDAI